MGGHFAYPNPYNISLGFQEIKLNWDKIAYE